VFVSARARRFYLILFYTKVIHLCERECLCVSAPAVFHDSLLHQVSMCMCVCLCVCVLACARRFSTTFL